MNPKLTPGTAQVIEMMMHKDPAERYQNASDLLHDLDLVGQGHPPHFARKQLDLTEVATSIATDAAVKSAPVVIQRQPERASPMESPVFVIAMVILGISLLMNLILTVLLAS